MLSGRYINQILGHRLYTLYGDIEIAVLTQIGSYLTNKRFLKTLADDRPRAIRQLERKFSSIINPYKKELDDAFVYELNTTIKKGVLGDESYFRKAVKAKQLEKFVNYDNSPVVKELTKAYEQLGKAQNAVIRANLIRGATNTTLNAISDVQASKYSEKTALDVVANRIGKDGLNFAAGGYSQELMSYVRNTTQDTILHGTLDISAARMEEVGVDLILVSSHVGARPLCAPYQGKVFSLSGSDPKYPALSSTSYGEPAGLFGINCRHYYVAYIDGVNRNGFENPSESLNDKVYEYQSEQRYNERQIREWKRKETMYDAIGSDKSSYAKGKVSYWQGRQRALLDKSGMARQYGRERI